MSYVTDPESVVSPLACIVDGPLKTAIRDTRDALVSAQTNITALSPYVFSFFFAGIPTDLQTMYVHFFPVAVTLPATLTGSKIAASEYGPTAETVLTVKKRTAAGVSSNIGTFTYAQTTGACTVAFTDAVSFAAGDSLLISNQADNDASAQGFAWTFVATRA